MTGPIVSAVAFCPHPPLLVPEIAPGIATEIESLRSACRQAIDRLLESSPDQIVIVGTLGPAVSFRDFAPGIAELPGQDRLPLPLLLGDWLIRQRLDRPALRYLAVDEDGTPAASWPDAAVPTGLLVMGDGSARRSLKGPGYLDDRAEPFDDAVVKALAGADTAALAALDGDLARQLLVAGVGPWKAFARFVGGDRRWQADVLYADAPFGVMYTVATWLPG